MIFFNIILCYFVLYLSFHRTTRTGDRKKVFWESNYWTDSIDLIRWKDPEFPTLLQYLAQENDEMKVYIKYLCKKINKKDLEKAHFGMSRCYSSARYSEITLSDPGLVRSSTRLLLESVREWSSHLAGSLKPSPLSPGGTADYFQS